MVLHGSILESNKAFTPNKVQEPEFSSKVQTIPINHSRKNTFTLAKTRHPLVSTKYRSK